MQSVRMKTTVLMDKTIHHNIDLCVLTETWLLDIDDIWVQSSDLCKYGYESSMVNRQDRDGGGIALVCRLDMKPKLSRGGCRRSFE